MRWSRANGEPLELEFNTNGQLNATKLRRMYVRVRVCLCVGCSEGIRASKSYTYTTQQIRKYVDISQEMEHAPTLDTLDFRS